MDQVSTMAVGAVGVGLVFLLSGLKGASVLSAVQDVIQGKQPAFTAAHPVDTPQASASGSQATSAAPSTGAGKQTCASQFGGSGDNTSSRGYHGDNLNGTMAFAELGMGAALGNLPYKQQIRITYKGKSVVASKLDIGAGGAGCGGHARGIDLWWETARALGFSGLDVVEYEVI